jgi:chorismate-pyruvate lyase
MTTPPSQVLPRKVPLFPLSEFYTQETMPVVVTIPPEEIPEPQRSLLVHQADMTPTLETYFETRIDLKVLKAVQVDMVVKREVVLFLHGSRTPVEFGAIQIHLSNFLSDHRELILANQVPLGTILNEQRIPHVSHPSAFIRVIPDQVIREALEITEPVWLYGRCNSLKDPDGWPLAEVVEVLPPLEKRE